MRLIPYNRSEGTPSRAFPNVSRFFEDFFSDFPIASGPTERQWMPSVDVLERDGNLILRAEIPGMEEKDIDLKLEGNLLTLKGERKFEQENRDNYHRVECFYGAFVRSFTLPDTVDRDKIKAEYKNGVLMVTIPQKPEVRPREIPVSTH